MNNATDNCSSKTQMIVKNVLIGLFITSISVSFATGQSGNEQNGPDTIIQKLEGAGVFEVPVFSFTSDYDAYKSYDHLQGLFFDALSYHGDSTRVFCWYGLPDNIPEGTKVPAVVLVHGGGGTVFPDWVRKWTDRGYAAISIALEGQVAGARDAFNKWPTHVYSGPVRTSFFSDLETEKTEDVWFYHAVADVILANSLIRSFEEIDTTRIGITGISWGGILTSVIAGIDHRFTFAVPVYGCGYLQDSPLYSTQMGPLSDTARMEYLHAWDPSNYIPRITMPTLYVNGTNDCHFTMNCFTRSFHALNVEKYLRVERNMKHGHLPGWEPESIYDFADYICRNGSQPVRFNFESLRNNGKVNFSYEGDLQSASLLYTTDTADWDCDNYQWMAVPAELDTTEQNVTVKIPIDAQYYFVNGISGEGNLYSSSMHKVEFDPAFHSYPRFSWDHVPLYMHMRKSTAFTQEELEYLAGFPILTLEKTTGSTTYGSTEQGSLEAARAIKSIDPDTRVLYYWNAMVHYTTYDVNAGVDTIPGAFLEDSTGNTLLHRGVREVYDLSNPDVRDWWVVHCVEMTSHEEIDGVFVDANLKAVSPGYLLAEIGEEKKQATMEGYDSMMVDMNLRMDSTKLKIANMIRATLPEAGLEYMHYFDGSYMEGIEGDPDYFAKGIAAAQTAAREGKIIAFCMNLADELAPLESDENGHLVLDATLQERMKFSLAMFLICSEEYSYFLLHDGYNVNPGASNLWMKRFAEYDKPLGPPEGPAVRSGYIYTREFEHASVWLDLSLGKGSITWDSDTITDPDPEPEKFTLKFVVREANSPAYVPEALITMDSLIKSTNLTGVLYFDLDSGSYHYTIEKPGFFPVDSSLHIFSDTVIQISLQSTTADVKFRIKEGEHPVAYADVSLNNDAMQTNNLGLAVFRDLPVFDDYSWSIEKEGYETVSGSFYLNQDTTINVQLNALTDVDNFHKDLLRIYPIPAESYFILESDHEMAEIQLVDLTGRVGLSESVTGKKVRIELPPGFPHICMLKVFFKDGTVVTKRVVVI